MANSKKPGRPRRTLAGGKRGLVLWGGLALLGIIGGFISAFAYIGVITHEIDSRIEQLHNAQGSRFYALPPAFRVSQNFTRPELQRFLEDQGYLEVHDSDELDPDQYAWQPAGSDLRLNLVRSAFQGAGHEMDRLGARIELEPKGDLYAIKSITRMDNNESVDHFDNTPRRIGSFFAGRLRTQSAIALSDIPVSVRLSVMAIEDVNFLEHSGVSLRSTARAFLRDLRAGHFVEGGSTITQQLMKNLFLSREKAISRKMKEAVFALVTEARHSKEEILEAYLNEVYLGQWSTHEIHGVSEGARYYFHRPVSELSLTQSATLAAIIQAPNAHDPRRFPQRCLQRRNLVLKKMLDAGFILPSEYQDAVKEPLGVISSDLSLDDTDYFMDLVMDRLPKEVKSRLDTDVLSIYVTLQPFLQAAASRALNANITRLEKNVPKIAARKKRGISLESALIAIDVKNCAVVALQGGRSYKQTQFNRVLEGRRQPGSLFKPFVYLSAFMKSTSSSPFSPLTLIDDSPFEWDYQGQVWKPHNYNNKFLGPVTAQTALENSMNIPTAKVAQMVGVDSILDVLRRAGIQSPLPAVPSIALGSASVTPFEVAEAYTTLANLGKSCALRPFYEIYDQNRQLVLGNPVDQKEALPPTPVYETVSLMKGVISNGTGRWALSSGLPLSNFAGKSGTTNDFKDAWFTGFSPDLLVVSWVGYDEEEPVGLSGSAAALPLWVGFLQNIRPFIANDDFPMPSDVMAVEVDPTTNEIATAHCPEKRLEYFVKGTEPKKLCSAHP